MSGLGIRRIRMLRRRRRGRSVTMIISRVFVVLEVVYFQELFSGVRLYIHTLGGASIFQAGPVQHLSSYGVHEIRGKNNREGRQVSGVHSQSGL